jgi:hypothetical protein
MCLTPEKREVLTAEEDIPVFKILRKSPNGYYSPVYATKWEPNETKTVPHFTGKDRTSKLHFGQLRNVRFTDQIPLCVDQIYQGLHSFRTKPVWVDDEKAIVAEMTIPKGTKYVIGEHGDLVSLALRFDWDTDGDFVLLDIADFGIADRWNNNE